MNKSYSKIRHIQEANQRLEKRLLSEQTLLGTSAVELAADLGKDIGSHPHIHEPHCEEYVPDRDYAWGLIQWALKSKIGSSGASTYYQDVDMVRKDVEATSAGNLIVKTIKKLNTPDAFASFVKSYYNRPGSQNGKMDLFRDLDSKDRLNPLFGWGDVVNAIDGSIKSASGVKFCKKFPKPSNSFRDFNQQYAGMS